MEDKTLLSWEWSVQYRENGGSRSRLISHVVSSRFLGTSHKPQKQGYPNWWSLQFKIRIPTPRTSQSYCAQTSDVAYLFIKVYQIVYYS